MRDLRTRRQLRTLAVVALVACVIAPFFNLLTDERATSAAAQGVVDALLISMAVGGYLLFVRDGLLRGWFRRLPFLANLALNGSAVLILFLLARGVGQVIGSGRIDRFYLSFLDTHLFYALPFFAVFAFALQFVLQMNRMVGTNVLGYFVAGVYHRPVEERRIFMFLDLVGSTQLAERLGSARYYELLRRFVDDLSGPIVATGGEIYQYAGDEVVITWREDRGLRNAACVRCYFLIGDEIRRAAPDYEREFGAVPRFRAGLHGGPVTAGELGDLKQQIVFVGDILNTAARLEEHAKREGLALVVSGDVLDRVELPAGVVAGERRDLELRGRTERMVARSLRRVAAQAGAPGRTP
jgi:adenylate cyclase